jgi:hypothetical protein
MHMVTGLYHMSVQAVQNVRKEAQAVPVQKQHAINPYPADVDNRVS